MGGTCRGEEYTEFWWGNHTERDPGVRLEDNIKTDHQEVGCGDMDWIELDQERTGGGHW
jgi:hypothetical protein